MRSPQEQINQKQKAVDHMRLNPKGQACDAPPRYIRKQDAKMMHVTQLALIVAQIKV